MAGKRIAVFIVMYVIIVLAMLFVYLFVQKEYGADPTRPYERRLMIRPPAQDGTDMRLSGTGFAGSGFFPVRTVPFDGTV